MHFLIVKKKVKIKNFKFSASCKKCISIRSIYVEIHAKTYKDFMKYKQRQGSGW